MIDKSTDQLILLAQMAAEDSSGFSIRNLISGYLPLLLIVITGLSLAIGGIFAIQNWDRQIRTTYLDGTRQLHINNLQGKLEFFRRRARLIQSFYLASGQVDPDEFERIARTLFESSLPDSFILASGFEENTLQPFAEPRRYFRANGPTLEQVTALTHSAELLAHLRTDPATQRPFTMTIRLGASAAQDYLLYGVPFTHPGHGHVLALSGVRLDSLLDARSDSISIEAVHTHPAEAPAAAPGADNELTTIPFENIAFILRIHETNSILERSRYFKWGLAIFAVFFTALLGIQFIYARKSVKDLAALAIARTNELTAINSDLTDEIMSRIQFQAELLERNTQIKDANQKLEDAQNQLIQQEKLASLGQLAAGVAHEINNPIGFINSNLSMLEKYVQRLTRILSAHDDAEKNLTDDNTRNALASLKKEIRYDSLLGNITAVIQESREGVDRVKRIVQDLKNFSRVDEQEWQWVDLREGIDSTLNIARNEIKYKATVHKEYHEIPLVECVPSQINQVVMNLLVNAAQAIADTGDIYVRTRRDGEKVLIEVEDNGPGIPANIIEKIFDPFFTTKDVGKGTGLGLSLSYGIIKKHGGELKVKSEPGKGAIFTLVLPIQQPARVAV